MYPSKEASTTQDSCKSKYIYMKKSVSNGNYSDQKNSTQSLTQKFIDQDNMALWLSPGSIEDFSKVDSFKISNDEIMNQDKPCTISNHIYQVNSQSPNIRERHECDTQKQAIWSKKVQRKKDSTEDVQLNLCKTSSMGQNHYDIGDFDTSVASKMKNLYWPNMRKQSMSNLDLLKDVRRAFTLKSKSFEHVEFEEADISIGKINNIHTKNIEQIQEEENEWENLETEPLNFNLFNHELVKPHMRSVKDNKCKSLLLVQNENFNDSRVSTERQNDYTCRVVKKERQFVLKKRGSNIPMTLNHNLNPSHKDKNMEDIAKDWIPFEHNDKQNALLDNESRGACKNKNNVSKTEIRTSKTSSSCNVTATDYNTSTTNSRNTSIKMMAKVGTITLNLDECSQGNSLSHTSNHSCVDSVSEEVCYDVAWEDHLIHKAVIN